MSTRRALGFDSQVFRLNHDILLGGLEWPSPNGFVLCIRSTARSLKAAALSLFWCAKKRKGSDSEADGEMVVEKALAGYRQKLHNTFGKSERIDDIVRVIGGWLKRAR